MSEEANKLRKDGNKAFNKDKFSQAIDLYTRAIQIDHSQVQNHLCYSNRAQVYLKQGEFEKCISDCDESINIVAEFNKAYYRKALALEGMQNFQDALDVLQEMKKVTPETDDSFESMVSL